jgi:hypothetical protein
MRKSFLLLITTLFLFSCEEKVERSDAYGNFEATISTVQFLSLFSLPLFLF